MRCVPCLRLAKALPGLRVAVRTCSEDLLCTSHPDLKCGRRKGCEKEINFEAIRTEAEE